MRENTKVIMLITAVAFVGLMVFEWGMNLSGRSSAQANGGEVGRIAGNPVSYEEFSQVYRALYDQQGRLQDEPISAAQERQIEDAAWDQLVVDRLVAQEVAKRGLEATATEVRQAARYSPPPEFIGNEMFQTDGQFDLGKYQQFLANSGDEQLLLQLEAYYRQRIPWNKLYRQVATGYYVPDAELWRMWKDQNEQVRMRYVALDPDAVVPEGALTVTDDEVEAFYREHQDDFVRPARADLRVVAIDKAPTAADTAAARDRAIKLRREIVDGADFAEVARRESADQASAEKGGDLGTFNKGTMTPAFDQAVWSLRVGQISEPVQTPFGFHLIEVVSRKGDEAHARHILVPIERTEDSEFALLDRADSLEALGGTMPLAQAAEHLGLTARTATINPELPLVAGLGQLDEGADWAFHEAEIADVSPVFESPGAYYMLELVDRAPAGTLSLAEAAPGIRDRLLAKKKLEKARQTGRELVDQIRQSSLDEAASARGLPIREAGPFTRGSFVPGLGQAFPVIGTAFGLEPGQTSGLVEANGTLYVLQVVERIPADSSAFEAQKADLRARMAAGMERERWIRFLAALKKEAKIVDRRDEVLRPAAAAS